MIGPQVAQWQRKRDFRFLKLLAIGFWAVTILTLAIYGVVRDGLGQNGFACQTLAWLEDGRVAETPVVVRGGTGTYALVAQPTLYGRFCADVDLNEPIDLGDDDG